MITTKWSWTELLKLFSVGALLWCVWPAPSANAGQITMEYTFERPEISTVVLEGVQYHRIMMPQAPNAGLAGQPALPARGARILLPAGTEVTSVEILAGERVFLGEDYYVEPVTKPFPLSIGPTAENLPAPDQLIYSSKEAFPASRYENVDTYGFRGFEILILKLQPVEYTPANGELSYYPQLTVKINTAETGGQSPLFRGLPSDKLEAQSKVDNPALADSYAGLARTPGDVYELLILTTPALAASFTPLKDYHDSTGTPTEIHTTAEVGSTNPDVVREYVREQYESNGIKYLLIGGDDDVIPAKDLYVDGETEMPVDLYFGCLDGTFNWDGDGRWGEPTDGENGGDVDLMAEVFVGRASVGNTVEAGRFVQKTLAYLAGRQAYLTDILMCGEYLWDGFVSYGCQYMEELIGSCTNHGYTTIGVPRSYNIDKLYDWTWPGHDWPAGELYSRLNGGIHLVNHLGHGNSNWALKTSAESLMTALNSDELFFVFSQACLSGHFDGLDCWAEKLNVKTDLGAFALIMNARYGYGSYESTDGASQRYHREFIDALFNPYDYKPELGRALQDCREDNLYRVSDPLMRWCYYEMTLFGDPAITFGFAKGGADDIAIDFPNGTPDTVLPNTQTSFDVEIQSMWEGVPLPGSVMLNYTINGGVLQSVPLTEIAPLHYEAVLPGILCEDVLAYYISAEVAGLGLRYNPDPGEPLSPAVISAVTSAFTDNFNADLGWDISGEATSGQWLRCIPTTLGEGCTPLGDYDGSHICYVTGGDPGADVDGGYTYLDSPVFDLSTGNAQVRYALWYCNDTGGDTPTDVFVTSISNDGGTTWVEAQIFGPDDSASGGWHEYSFWVSGYVTPTEQMRLRFAASDLGDESIIEAAIDAVRVLMFECKNCDCPGYCDLNGDELINPLDVAYIVNFVYKQLDSRQALAAICPYDNGDWDCSGQVTPLDVAYFVKYVYKQIGNGPENPCVGLE